MTYLERVPEAGDPETYAIPFSCECGRSRCSLQPQPTVAAYARLIEDGRFLEAPSHVIAEDS